MNKISNKLPALYLMIAVILVIRGAYIYSFTDWRSPAVNKTKGTLEMVRCEVKRSGSHLVFKVSGETLDFYSSIGCSRLGVKNYKIGEQFELHRTKSIDSIYYLRVADVEYWTNEDYLTSSKQAKFVIFFLAFMFLCFYATTGNKKREQKKVSDLFNPPKK